jgi:hypothetical protein
MNLRATGDRLRVDGERGAVEVLEPGQNTGLPPVTPSTVPDT